MELKKVLLFLETKVKVEILVIFKNLESYNTHHVKVPFYSLNLFFFTLKISINLCIIDSEL